MADYPFNGLGVGLGNLSRLSNAVSRSISAENFTGEPGNGGKATSGTGAGYARELGTGWKISPSVMLKARSTFELARINAAGAIQHIWMTTYPAHWRRLILRAYWDGEEAPSIECPLGDFFGNGWCERANLNSLPVSVNPAGGFNCYWEMPFRQSARFTIENLHEEDILFFYQIDYCLTSVPTDVAYFHACWQRSNPLPYGEGHTIVANVLGKGQYVGTYLAWQVNNSGWWGEGEVKFYLDDDSEYPTICGTGTEDYFGGAWNWEQPPGEYGSYSTPFLGLHQIIKPDGLYRSQTRFGMYRWHIPDPVRFETALRVTVQALGWRSGSRYLPLQDDIASVAYWYQTEPHQPYPSLPDINALEVV